MSSNSMCTSTPSRLCKTRYNTTAPMYGVSLTSGQPVTIVQKFPDLLQQVVFEVNHIWYHAVINLTCRIFDQLWNLKILTPRCAKVPSVTWWEVSARRRTFRTCSWWFPSVPLLWQVKTTFWWKVGAFAGRSTRPRPARKPTWWLRYREYEVTSTNNNQNCAESPGSATTPRNVCLINPKCSYYYFCSLTF